MAEILSPTLEKKEKLQDESVGFFALSTDPFPADLICVKPCKTLCASLSFGKEDS